MPIFEMLYCDQYVVCRGPLKMSKIEKVVPESHIGHFASSLRKDRKKIVTTNGCFDLLHVGQVRSLQLAKTYGDVLIVGVNTDFSIRRIKGNNRPIIPFEERIEMLAALQCVDYVCAFSGDDPIEWISEIRPDVHVKGSDRNPQSLKEYGLVERWGGKLVIVPYTQPGFRSQSTTSIIEKIRSLPDVE